MGTDYKQRRRPWDDADLTDAEVTQVAPTVMATLRSPYGTHSVRQDLMTGIETDPGYDPEQWDGYDELLDDVRANGIQTPILVCWEHYKLLDGHWRIRAALDLGLPELPAIDRCFGEPF